MNKVIFISHDPLTDTIKKNFFLERFIADGIDVEYWCLRHILPYGHKAALNNEIKASFFIDITSKEQLRELLKQRATDARICIELWFNWDTLAVFSILQPYIRQSFSIDWYGNMPAISVKKKLIGDIKALKFTKLFHAAQRVFSKKLFSSYSRLKNINPTPLLFLAGSKDISDSRRKVISLNHHDFDIFSEHAADDVAVPGYPYAVFLDVMLPYHPDFKRLGSSVLDPATYYSKLNAFFDKVEEQLGIPVVIAAHPKSAYEKEFGDRVVIKSKTSPLVAGSKMVFTHHSVSLYYAVLFRKPLGLLTMNEFKFAGSKSFVIQIIHYLVELYAQILGCTAINIDEYAALNFNAVDNQAYEHFEKKYIRGNSDKPNYEVIKQTLQLL